MKTFYYRGQGPGGRVSGAVQAADDLAAVEQLKQQGILLTALRERKPEKPMSRKPRDPELAVLCAQFSILLQSGLPLVRCVELVGQQAADGRLRQALHRAARELTGGASLSHSLQKHIPGLPEIFIRAVRAGESSGTLPESFARLRSYFDRVHRLKSKVRNALMYPALVLCVAMVVFGVILVVAVPMFADVFAQLKAELPWITRVLLRLSAFLRTDGWLLGLIVAVAAGAVLLLRQDPRSSRWLSDFVWAIGPLKTLRTLDCCSRFADTMCTLLAAGLSIPEALAVTGEAVGNPLFSRGTEEVRRRVLQGSSLAGAMEQAGCFPSMLVQMTGVGEEAGLLEQSLQVAGDYYSDQLQQRGNRLLTVLEPAMTLILAALTVVLLLAVYLPLFQLNGAVG